MFLGLARKSRRQSLSRRLFDRVGYDNHLFVGRCSLLPTALRLRWSRWYAKRKQSHGALSHCWRGRPHTNLFRITHEADQGRHPEHINVSERRLFGVTVLLTQDVRAYGLSRSELPRTNGRRKQRHVLRTYGLRCRTARAHAKGLSRLRWSAILHGCALI